ncbi:MAG TPA: dihydrofolate reductase family protein [Solirubrobacteraceae bacterium]|nr:dihydrofolate reductase family protein [Solirubrobacteraceae bacterium]
MAKIVISENVSLDGVGQDPTGDEGLTHVGWFERTMDGDREAWARVEFDEALRATALLMGRRTYEYFAPRWKSRTGEWADRLKRLPKYVVSSTLVDPDWGTSSVLNGDVVEEVSKLKRELDGEIVVNGSFQLGRALMEHDLVDEVRLIVFPVVLGAGERLFGAAGDERPMRLVDTRTVGEGLAFLAYTVDRKA